MNIKDLDFIASHYRKGRFIVDNGWRRLGIASFGKRRGFRIAAAVAATVILTAAACIIYQNPVTHDTPRQEMPVKTANPLAEIKAIDFENTPLPEVVREIETVYDVRVGNVPEMPEKYVLSLHYEGTPGDLISTINDILGTEMTVAEK